jgi:hypothetical protein
MLEALRRHRNHMGAREVAAIRPRQHVHVLQDGAKPLHLSKGLPGLPFHSPGTQQLLSASSSSSFLHLRSPISKVLQLSSDFQVSSAFCQLPSLFSFLQLPNFLQLSQLPSFFSFLQLPSFFSFLKLMSSSFSSNFFSSSSLFLFVLLLISRSRTKLVSKCGTKFTLQLEVCNYTKLLCIIIHDWIGIRESPFLFSGCK